MANFILIDGSYFCFYRYYALLRWWSLARKDIELDDPYDNQEFKEKFESTFINKIKEIPLKLKIKNPIILTAKDCPRDKIWRNQYINNYKEGRDTDNNFKGGPFFKLAYNELWKRAGIEHILKYDSLEADDCIALTVEKILETDKDANIWIIANDCDYLQLVSNNVFLYNLKYKNISESKNSTKNAECDKFCKIVCGDKSDNISGIFNKCGIKTAIKYYNDQESFKLKLENDKSAQNKFKLNTTLIDFKMIPEHLKIGFKQDVLLST